MCSLQHMGMHRNMQGAGCLRLPLPNYAYTGILVGAGSQGHPSPTALMVQHVKKDVKTGQLYESPFPVLEGEAALPSSSPSHATGLPCPPLPVSTQECTLVAGTCICCEGFGKACMVLQSLSWRLLTSTHGTKHGKAQSWRQPPARAGISQLLILVHRSLMKTTSGSLPSVTPLSSFGPRELCWAAGSGSIL